MNLYPALQAHMGSWKYYIAKMKMKEVANEVNFAYDIYDDRTLSDAIQRDLNEGRVKKEIVTFLTGRKDRFFASLVVAAIGGSPKFYAVAITEEKEFAVFKDQGLDEAFGVLTFSGKQQYYALDGQHRLKAIKTLLDPNEPAYSKAPEGFGEEEISVLIVIKRDEPQEKFLQAYRRLFSSLNRYAKPMNLDTSIIMDEDDAFAIVTRRLISEHPFFAWTGKQKDSPRIKMSGKGLKEKDPHFTSLQTLYQMNTILLTSKVRASLGWGRGTLEKDRKQFMRFRPNEDYLDELYSELTVHWNALGKVLPVLEKDPAEHKNHEEVKKDNLLFWPIGQELMAAVARRLLDDQDDADIKTPKVENEAKALAKLGKVDWAMHGVPWEYFLLTKIDDVWKMRSEGRNEALELAEKILRAMVGIDSLAAAERKELRERWLEMLMPAPTADETKELSSKFDKVVS